MRTRIVEIRENKIEVVFVRSDGLERVYKSALPRQLLFDAMEKYNRLYVYSVDSTRYIIKR